MHAEGRHARTRFGVWFESGAWCARIWAPRASRVAFVLDGPRLHGERPLHAAPDGSFSAVFDDLRAGDRYRYRVDGGDPRPDPGSRYQPDGVHGPSAIVDPHAFAWQDGGWHCPRLGSLVFYELHVGTFSPEGTFDGAARRLPHLADLGITAVQLMPVADFAGRWNWGYDGVSSYAPARCYGTPDDLRRFVDRAHGLGLAVFVDVVYNHLGPDGAYHGEFSPLWYGDRDSPWGRAMNLDGEGGEMVRAFFIDNALHWLDEYHADGLRLDATHALVDRREVPFLAELTAAVTAACGEGTKLVVAEDHRNLATMITPREDGGWGLDGVWADDFHHVVRRLVAGDRDGYYRDFKGTTQELAETVRGGWLFSGQWSDHLGGPRGTDPQGISKERFVTCLQNHDQVGNRAFGDRLHHAIDLAAWRAASALLLMAPETPLLFMGQEWAASTPFQFFTDHHAELGRLVTEGRRREFRHFRAFADPAARARIPDPQASATFEASRLDWREPALEPHASVLRLYRALLALRASHPACRRAGEDSFCIAAVDDGSVALERVGADGSTLLLLARLRGAGRVARPPAFGQARAWSMALTTEDAGLADDPRPIREDVAVPAVVFERPGAAVLRSEP